jgi:pyruvate,water dikinase
VTNILDGAVLVMPLGEAVDARVAGPKAANLARARRAGLPVLDGFVLTTAGAAAWQGASGTQRAAVELALARAWTDLSGGGTVPLVVRSSGAAEDGQSSSMAGRFLSVIDVSGWSAFRRAVGSVLASADDGSGLGGRSAMAVLVQPFLDPAASGVLFGLDPVTGRIDRRMLAAVAGGPQDLVAGRAGGVRLVLTPGGQVIQAEGDGPHLGWRRRRALLRLERRAAGLFGGPQDIEWALDAGSRPVLLQSRPVTAAGPGRPTGPVLGPGPLAETFPDPLFPLEEDLWVPPLRQALAESLHLAGAVSRRRLAASPLVVAVGGRLAVDLELVGATPRSPWRRLDPRPPLRRLGAAWRVGRLRAALPHLAADLVARLDGQLAAVPALEELDDDHLARLLRHTGTALRAVHGHEMLAGLLGGAEAGPTAAGAALAALAAGRAGGGSDAEIASAHPVVLTLSVPAVGRSPAQPPVLALPAGDTAVPDLAAREALRLRARWLHELTARAALEAGRRLVVRGRLAHPLAVRLLALDEVVSALSADAAGPIPLFTRRFTPTAPLPAAFRLTPDGTVVAEPGGVATSGRGAGAGRAVGPVHQGPAEPPEGSVLVVSALEPGLAPWLPRLAALVAETGSPLSHLAILAREHHLPVVVGLSGALERFLPGTIVAVDGGSGEVTATPAPEVDLRGGPEVRSGVQGAQA